MSHVQDDLSHKTSSIFKVVFLCISFGPSHSQPRKLLKKITVIHTARTQLGQQADTHNSTTRRRRSGDFQGRDRGHYKAVEFHGIV